MGENERFIAMTRLNMIGRYAVLVMAFLLIAAVVLGLVPAKGHHDEMARQEIAPSEAAARGLVIDADIPPHCGGALVAARLRANDRLVGTFLPVLM